MQTPTKIKSLFQARIFTEYLSLFGIVMTIFVVVFLYTPLKQHTPINTIDTVTKETPLSQPPVINLPMKYFPKDTIAWGSVRDSIEDTDTWNSAALDIGYHSFPTTTITISPDQYSNEVTDLPTIKSDKEILPIINPEDEWASVAEARKERFIEQIEKYGDLARSFLPDDGIVFLNKFDVDADGSEETIIGICGDGGNHCPHKIIIVKEGKIIFSTWGSMSTKEMISSDTPNGFFIKWANDEQENQGFSSPSGYMKTRFVYEDGKFVPVYEQEILYVEVKNTD